MDVKVNAREAWSVSLALIAAAPMYCFVLLANRISSSQLALLPSCHAALPRGDQQRAAVQGGLGLHCRGKRWHCACKMCKHGLCVNGWGSHVHACTKRRRQGLKTTKGGTLGRSPYT